MKFLLTLLSCLLAGGCATLPSGKPDPRDPWERFNRATFKFNDALDRAIARPVAKAYVKVTPRVIRTGVSNAFSNLDTVPTIINDALQGKFRMVGHDSARFLLNSTLGLGGLFDPASAAGLEYNEEDLGQTFGLSQSRYEALEQSEPVESHHDRDDARGRGGFGHAGQSVSSWHRGRRSGWRRSRWTGCRPTLP